MSIEFLIQNYGPRFIPLQLREEIAQGAQHWIGGAPPQGILPKFINKQTRHLATLELESNLSATLFTTFDYQSASSPHWFFGATYRMLADSPLFEVVLHDSTRCSGNESLEAEFPALGLEFGEERTDSQDPYPEHKVGGFPYFENIEKGIEVAAREVMKEGYCHMLQLAFPGDMDTLINADWPFGFSIFHIFAKREDNTYRFRFCWG